MSVLRSFLRDRRGATAIEYALIITCVAAAVVGGATALGPQVAGSFNSAANGFGPSAS